MAKADVTGEGFVVFRLRTNGPQFMGVYFSRAEADAEIAALENIKSGDFRDFAVVKAPLIGRGWEKFQPKWPPKLSIVSDDA